MFFCTKIPAAALFLALQPAFAAVPAEPSQGEVPHSNEFNASTFGEKAKDRGHSIAPLVGYDPTFGVVAGGAYFFQGEQVNFGLDASLNFREVYQTHGRFSINLADRARTEGNFTFIKGFAPYYGEGGVTPPTMRQIWGNRFEVQSKMLFQITDKFSVGGIADLRSRTEVGAPDGGTFNRVAPDSSVFAVGLISEYDTRRDKTRSTDGFVFTQEILHGPPQAGRPSFTQFNGSFVVYKEIMEGFIPDVVAAFRLMGGASIGDVPYAFRYQLGGAKLLPGYLENRFRGSRFYLQQTELRFPIWRMIGGAFSLGFGDASDGEFIAPKMAYGVGLRIGLPPDWISKIRVDICFGKDQFGVFADFGQTF